MTELLANAAHAAQAAFSEPEQDALAVAILHELEPDNAVWERRFAALTPELHALGERVVSGFRDLVGR